MRNDLPVALRALVLPTLALVVVVAFVPGRSELAVRVYALVVCAVALLVAIAELRRAYPPARPLRARPGESQAEPLPPPGLTRIETEVALGVASAFDLHFRLRPRLRDVAVGLLRSRRRIALEGDPEQAREALGDETWELLRPDRPAPEDRLARGIPEPSLRRVIQSLERL